MILVYDSSQSAILSLGENTGQLAGNFRYGMWSNNATAASASPDVSASSNRASQDVTSAVA
jgi:hypothetical protein